MKYYCEKCGFAYENSEEIIWGAFCPVCRKGMMTYLPAYETVAKWEKRKRRKYPDTAPVYARWIKPRMPSIELHWKDFSFRERESGWTNWLLYMYEDTFNFNSKKQIIVATEAGAPPDNWRPE